MALRTPEFGGFQLLDLQDYPGQGTALVGILDAFCDSKEVIAREKWTEFCNDVAPLAAFPKYCWQNKEVFTSVIQVANYGPESLENQDVHCVLKDKNDLPLFQKTFSGQSIRQGKLNTIGDVAIPLQEITDCRQLILTVSISGSEYTNSWNLWVYPAGMEPVREGTFQKVVVTRDRTVFEQSRDKEVNMLYIPHHREIREQSVGGLFITDFWNYKMFNNMALNMKKEPSPGTLGLLIQSTHPLFALFPTDFHSDWQWWHIVKRSRPMILDDMPKDYFPIVQVIDNFERNHKLGLIYELPDAKGQKLVCTSDLFACPEKPEVKALFRALLHYLQQ
jgi:hypothetical protein